MKHALVLAFAFVSSVAMADTFKMYSQPFAQPDQSCDVFTSLQIDYGKGGITATLVDSLSGTCRMFVQPNPRAYIVPAQGVDDGCGSKTYLARNSATGRPMFTLVDNRHRTCENLIPALIVITEYNESGVATTLYSKDN
jgi:hypothetical protein